MTNKEAIQVLQRTAWLGGETYGLQNRAEQVAEAIRMAITALQAQDIDEKIGYMERLNGGGNYRDALEKVITALEISDSIIQQLDCKKDIPTCDRNLPSVQPKPDKNPPPEQPDSDRLGVKTGETCTDTISRQAAIEWCLEGLNNMPSVQPEIIRCRDCKYFIKDHGCSISPIHKVISQPDYFCSRAKRRTDG